MDAGGYRKRYIYGAVYDGHIRLSKYLTAKRARVCCYVETCRGVVPECFDR